MRGLESPIPVRPDRFVDGAPPRDLVLSESHDVHVADALPAQVLDERQQRRSRLPDGNPVGTKPNLVRLGHVGSIVSLRTPTAHPHDGCMPAHGRRTGGTMEDEGAFSRLVEQGDSSARDVSRARKAGLQPRKEEEWR